MTVGLKKRDGLPQKAAEAAKSRRHRYLQEGTRGSTFFLRLLRLFAAISTALFMDQPSLFAEDSPEPEEAALRPGSGLAADAQGHQPLAARMRPRRLDEIVGQVHILKPGSLLTR